MAKLSAQSDTANTVKIIADAFDFLAENGWGGHFELTTPAGNRISYKARVRVAIPIMAKNKPSNKPAPKKAKRRT